MLLDLAGMIPGAGAVPDLLNATISVAKGDYIEAALSVVSAVPGLGDAAGAAKIAKNAEKYAQALVVVETKVLPKLPESVGKPLKAFIDKAKNKIDEIRGPKKDVPEPTKPKNEPEPTKGDTQIKGRNCDALANGLPGSEYKGGSHEKISPGGKSRDQEMHHMPAAATSPHPYAKGPGIQMDKADHAQTASHDRKPGADAYRAAQSTLIKSGGKSGFMSAFLMDASDIESKFPGKYSAAILQAMAYAKCVGYM
jgi:hypothetical protein